MLQLDCTTQKYGWGKLGSKSIVGQIFKSSGQEEQEESKGPEG